MLLITATVIAIAFFTGCYVNTVRGYFVLLGMVQPVVHGKIKSTFLYSSVLLHGEYKGRKVICGIEQLKEGGDALVVRMRLNEIQSKETSSPNKPSPEKVTLSGGWLAPTFSISKNRFNAESLKQQLDRIVIMCDSLERHRPVSLRDKKIAPRMEYKTLEF